MLDFSHDKYAIIIWDVTTGETGWEVYRNSLYYLLNFSVNINYSKIKCLFKRITGESMGFFNKWCCKNSLFTWVKWYSQKQIQGE